MTAELAMVGSQCRGERHEQVIARQRDALVELRAKIRVMESGNNPRNYALFPHPFIFPLCFSSFPFITYRFHEPVLTGFPWFFPSTYSASVDQLSLLPSVGREMITGHSAVILCG